jgi:hypothetical protein
MTDLIYSVSNLSNGQSDTTWLKASATIHINYLLWSKASGIQRNSYQTEYSKGLEVTSQEPIKN